MWTYILGTLVIMEGEMKYDKAKDHNTSLNTPYIGDWIRNRPFQFTLFNAYRVIYTYGCPWQ